MTIMNREVKDLAREVAQHFLKEDVIWTNRQPFGKNEDCLASACFRVVGLKHEFSLETENALFDVIRLKTGKTVTDWNDEPGRTKDDILKLLYEIANGN